MNLLQECIDAPAALLRSLPCCTQLLLCSFPGALSFLQSESRTRCLDFSHPLPEKKAGALTIAPFPEQS